MSASQQRFAFGKNWSNFLEHLSEDRISCAEQSLRDKLNLENLNGLCFLDIGSGSGLFSLAAYRLGANVISFDYDQDSVQCTRFLQQRYAPNDPRWQVSQGSVLDQDFLNSLGKADIVYSWGVLHHTGNMYQAFANVAPLVKENGHLFISIYNDQGGASQRWKWIKERYNKSGKIGRFLLSVYTVFQQWKITMLKDLLKSGNPLKTWFAYGKSNRGMSAYYDIIDWVGGYPFEVAKPEEVFNFFHNNHGFELLSMKTCAGGLGCNEFVFKAPKAAHT